MKDKITLDEAIETMNTLGMDEYMDLVEYKSKDEPLMTFIWLAVDSNGYEKMTSCELGFQRFSPRLYHSDKSINKEIHEAARKERKKICSFNDTQMKHDHWIEVPRKEDIGRWGAYPQWTYLPKGTIKKLIGRDLTWEDEPVKYEGEL